MNIPPSKQLKACLCCSCIADEITEIILSLEKDMMRSAMPYGNLHDWIINHYPIKTMDVPKIDPFIVFENKEDKPDENSTR